jgi:hypothetical protein
MAADPLVIARTGAGADLLLSPALANRHGLITGATGTGKTVTLQVLAERFASIGVPTFTADVKSDLSGLAAAGAMSPKLRERLTSLGLPEPAFGAASVEFWDIFGETGHPVRATVSDMGPLLLGRLLDLNDTQRGVLTIVFRIADDAGLLLLDLKDLRAMLQFVGDSAKQFTTEYGNISAASVGAIQRGLLALEDQGGDRFFGEPMLDIDDLLQIGRDGRGVINILTADRLINSPALYATFLLWLLSELFERLPEVGDPDRPRIVFFFDEAHLLFDDAPDALVDKIEQVVRLIRSKGVGVFFVTQSPSDIPEPVLRQLGNRIHHALRAYTPRETKAVKVLASTLRPNPAIDPAVVVTELAVGEALVSLLDEKGTPTPVERAWMLAPGSRIGPIDPAEREAARRASVMGDHYRTTVDRESAYEKLKARTQQRETAAQSPVERSDAPAGRSRGAQRAGGPSDTLNDLIFGSTGPRGGRRDGLVQAAAKSAARSVGSSVGRQILRGVLGSIFGGRR